MTKAEFDKKLNEHRWAVANAWIDMVFSGNDIIRKCRKKELDARRRALRKFVAQEEAGRE